MDEQIKKKLEELHERCSDLIDKSWEICDSAVEAIVDKQTRIIRDLIDIIKDYASK